jgi:hypothetical protein
VPFYIQGLREVRQGQAGGQVHRRGRPAQLGHRRGQDRRRRGTWTDRKRRSSRNARNTPEPKSGSMSQTPAASVRERDAHAARAEPMAKQSKRSRREVVTSCKLAAKRPLSFLQAPNLLPHCKIQRGNKFNPERFLSGRLANRVQLVTTSRHHLTHIRIIASDVRRLARHGDGSPVCKARLDARLRPV